MTAKWLCPLIGLATTLFIGYAHGKLIDRWHVSADVEKVASRLDQVPESFGDWVSKPGRELSAKGKLKAGAIGYLSRTYTNSKTGAQVNVMVLCGRPGPIASHDPSVCFTQVGMQQMAPEEKRKLKLGEEKQVEFLSASFRPPSTSPGPDLETYWALSADGRQWTAVSDGRVKFAREPYLFRTYLTSQISGSDVPAGAVAGFLSDFLPVLSAALNPIGADSK